MSVVVVSLAIGAILTWVHIANVVMLYLPMVLAVATRFGSGPAMLASVLAVLTFNWFSVLRYPVPSRNGWRNHASFADENSTWRGFLNTQLGDLNAYTRSTSSAMRAPFWSRCALM